MPALSLRLSDELEHRLEEEAHREGVPRSEVARQAISDFLSRREKERFTAELVAAAKSLVENTEALQEASALAEEALPLDREALDVVESRKPGDPWPGENGKRWWK